MSARMDEFRRRVWKESIRQAQVEKQEHASITEALRKLEKPAAMTDWPFRLTRDDRQFLRVRRIRADD